MSPSTSAPRSPSEEEEEEEEAPRTKLYTSETFPYTNPANALQTVTIYHPLPQSSPSSSRPPAPSPSPSPSTPPPPPTPLWLIYIHGGAWRDPLITSSTITPTLDALLSTPHHHSPRLQFTAYASISYTLSPYPTHPTQPSADDDPARNSVHPRHLEDVRLGMRFLRERFGVGGGEGGYVLLGHSCGATLAWQSVLLPLSSSAASSASSVTTTMTMTTTTEARSKSSTIKSPLAIISVAGIHDIPLLLAAADPEWKHVYSAFLTGAFGTGDRRVWAAASPALILTATTTTTAPCNNQDEDGDEDEGGVGVAGVKLAVLAQSKADVLVGWGQLEGMRAALRRGWRGEGVVVEMEGGHDECWESGREMARVVGVCVERLEEMMESGEV